MSDAGKAAAGQAAAALVEDGMRLGLGTGSTVAFFLDALVERGVDVMGLPTSEATATRCRQLGIRLLDPGDTDRLELAVDGADELDHDLSLTKGGGGAMLREKVVAAMADRFVVIATPDKIVERLAARFPLPVEVVPFALSPVTRALVGHGFEVVPRRAPDGGDYRTDNGNAVLDCRLPGGIGDPAATAVELGLIPGVAETGLFVGLADVALLGREDGSIDELAATPDRSRR